MPTATEIEAIHTFGDAARALLAESLGIPASEAIAPGPSQSENPAAAAEAFGESFGVSSVAAHLLLLLGDDAPSPSMLMGGPSKQVEPSTSLR